MKPVNLKIGTDTYQVEQQKGASEKLCSGGE